MHKFNSWLTLTYDDSHLPAGLSLRHSDVQLFLKRLRKAILPKQIRYFMCGEYGDESSRPHYHLCVFGFHPADKVFWKDSPSGSPVYTSAFLKRVWRGGDVYVGDLTFESAAYTARYIMKKQLGKDAGKRREIFNVETGEIFTREHEYAKRSLKPGIGAGFLSEYFSDVYPHDRVVVRGRACGVPKYYDVLLERQSPLYLADLKAARRAKADLRFDETTPRRLRDEEVVVKARVGLLPRNLE